MKAVIACVLLAAAAPFARADITVGVYANVPGEAVPSVDVFYDQLAPYGQWVNDPEIGTDVFIPSDPDYVPYTNGHWEYTDIGMVWMSSEPFAWATSHYGRWYYSNSYGRWAWMPDTEWGPSWVEWRESGDTFGWAPIPPTVIIDRGYREPMYAWHYAPADRLVDPDLDRYYVPTRDIARYHRSARPLQAYGEVNHRQVVVGPHPDVLRQHNVAVQPHRLDARAMGRVNPGELRQRAPSQPQPRPQTQPRPQQVAPQPRATQPRATQPTPQPRPESRPMQVTPRPMTRPMQPAQPAQPRPEPRPQPMQRTQPTPQPAPQPRAMQPAPQPRPEARPMQVAPRPEPRPMQAAPRPEPRPMQAAPQARPQPPQARPQPPQARPQPPQARPQPSQARPQPPQARHDDRRKPDDHR